MIIEPAKFSRAENAARKPFFQPSPGRVAVLCLFLVLAAAALFMFSASAVKFSPTPDDAIVKIESGLPTYRLGERYLMLEGDYDIQILAEGYYPLTETVSVSDDAEQAFDFELEKLPGILRVTSFHSDEEVIDAAVFIDQVERGKTPLVLNEVTAGSRDLYVTHPRFQPVQIELFIEGQRIQQSESITLAPAWANYEVSSTPSGATIIVDGQAMGTTPATIEVIEGDRNLMLQRDGYKTFESALQVVAQADTRLDDIVLVKSDGKLNIVSEPGGVNITISGRYYGQTPLSIALPPADNYQLLATRAGYQQQQRSFSIKADQDQRLNLNLKPITGLVKLNVTPAGGVLYVDGVANGKPNQTLELIARAHDLRVELPGHAPFETRIVPQPGLPQQLNISLQTKEEARVAAIPTQLTTSLGDTLRFIVPGEMTMGAGRREPGRRANEVEKNVELTRSFYLGEKEISNQSFGAFNPAHNSGMLGRALLSEPDRPVVNISWEQAASFCNWLSEKEGLPVAYKQEGGSWKLITPVTTGYRLPTEAEWAWAARYATGSKAPRFPWGDNMPPPDGAGNFADDSAAAMVPYSIRGYNDSYRGPAPSGTFAANALGIYDLAGNVSEWVNDLYSVAIERELLVDPTGPDSGDYHVVRGSNYTHGRFSELRWTFRDYGNDARPDVGFRIARYAEVE